MGAVTALLVARVIPAINLFAWTASLAPLGVFGTALLFWFFVIRVRKGTEVEEGAESFRLMLVMIGTGAFLSLFRIPLSERLVCTAFYSGAYIVYWLVDQSLISSGPTVKLT